MSSNTRIESGKMASWPMFDWLRLILASVVAFHHDGVVGFPYAADLAVQVFFALSGWLIGGILLKSNSKDMPRFYYNRATRIWIPYALAMVLFYGVSLLKEPITASWLEFLFYDITFVHQWFVPMLQATGAVMPLEGTGNHFWSISVEEQFYLAAPLIIIFAKYGRNVWLWGLLAAIALATGYFASICIGVLLAVLRVSLGEWHEATKMRVIIAVVAVLSGIGLFVWQDYYGQFAPIFSGAVVLMAAQRGERSAIGSFFGGVSYPFYLNHWVGIFAAHEVAQFFDLGEHWTMKVLAYLISLGFSSVLYIAVDQQIQRHRGKFFTQKTGKSLAAIAYGLVIVGVIGGLIMRF